MCPKVSLHVCHVAGRLIQFGIREGARQISVGERRRIEEGTRHRHQASRERDQNSETKNKQPMMNSNN